MNEYIAFWKNGFNFNGRTTRRGFWMAMLFNFIFTLILFVFAELIGANREYVESVVSLVLAIPTLAISVRRLRDINKPWPYVLLMFIPVVSLVLVYFFCQPSSNFFDPEV